MPTYSSKQAVKSGVPLGGIGSGKVEIMPTGVLDNFTFLNNYNNPLTNSTTNDPSGVLGFSFGIYCKDRKKKIAKLLQTIPIANYPAVEEITYKGEFPFAFLRYQDAGLPLEVSMEAYSPFIPLEEKNSCLPLACFRFTVTNPTSRPLEVGLLANMRNLIGDWCVGRFNQVIDEADVISLTALLRRHAPLDQRQGSMSLAVMKSKHYSVSFLGEYNLAAKPFVFDRQTVRMEAFELFSKDGDLPNINSEVPVSSESVELAGALAVKFSLKPKSKLTIPIVLSWNFPLCFEGHAYSNYFRNSREVINYYHANAAELYRKTSQFVASVKSMGLPAWLEDALLNNLYTFFSSTLWTKKMHFAFLESPQACPLAGTLDVRFYSSIALLLFFPQLEQRTLMQFAEAQRADGYIMHDLGRMRLDMPSVSTNRLAWKDLNSKFILMAYRDFLWIGDEQGIRKLFPFIKKAFFWLIATDKNNDFLPDNEGADHTFDVWSCYGTSAYTSSLFLAACLALQRMSQILEDKETEKVAHEYFKKGRVNFEKKLWQKTYFIEYNNRNNRSFKGSPKVSTSCTVGQLAGQWYAHLLGLGYILPRKKVQSAIKAILSSNAQDSPYGITNSMTANGERDTSCSHAANIIIGVNYSFLSLAIYEGFGKEAGRIGQRIWSALSEHQKNAWNQPDMYSSSSAEFMFGDHYMRNLCIWSLVFALSQQNKKIQQFLKTIKEAVASITIQ